MDSSAASDTKQVADVLSLSLLQSPVTAFTICRDLSYHALGDKYCVETIANVLFLRGSDFDFSWEPTPWEKDFRHAFASQWQKDSGTYLTVVNEKIEQLVARGASIKKKRKFEFQVEGEEFADRRAKKVQWRERRPANRELVAGGWSTKKSTHE